MKLFSLIFFIFVELELVFGCIHSESIECVCASDVIKCSGFLEDSVQIQQLFANISLVHSSGHLESLVLNITNLHSLSDIYFTSFNIKNLTLINGFQNISDSFLSMSFSDLNTLKIQGNNIHRLANQPFHSLYNLVELHLESNEISEIETEAFLNLSSLELLNLSNNRLSSIDENFLVHLPLIQTLSLNENNISSVSDIQAYSLSLTKLSAQNCFMGGVLEKNSLSGLSFLNYVDFSGNQIEGINSFALSSLLNIKKLNLSNNSIQYLEDNAFSELVSLEVLDLSSNKISLIKTTAFNKLSNLLHLNLKDNLLRAMLCDYTLDLHSLTKVDLRGNRIKTVNSGTFLYSHNIQELFLEGNALDESDAIICSPLPNITIAFIDIDFESKNCEIPDPCGALLPNVDDYESDFDDNSTVTSDNLKELTTTEMESFSSSINPLYSSISETSTHPLETTEMDATLLLLNTTQSNLVTESTDSTFLNTLTTPEADLFDTTGMEVTLLLLNTTSSNLVSESTDSSLHNTLTTPEADSSSASTGGLTVTEIDSTSTTNVYVNVTGSDYVEVSRSTSELTSNLNEYSLSTETESKYSGETESSVNASTQFIDESILSTETESKYSGETESSVNVSTQFIEDYDYINNTKAILATTETSSASIIVSNYSLGTKLCFRWTLLSRVSQKHVCIEKHDSCSGRGIKYLTCPKSGTFNEDCIKKNDILKFCLRVLVEGVEIDKTCIQPKPYISCENRSTSKLSSTSTVSSTETTRLTTAVTIPTFSNPITKEIHFKLTSFDVIYNSSYYGVAVWQVNTNKNFETCKLILKLTYVDSRKLEIVFSCSNDSYVIKNLSDLEEICLQSKDEKYGTETKCRHIFVMEEANAYKTKDHGYKNSSLFALSILLLVVLALIIFLVVRNLLKKRLDRDRYNVYIEEQNVQKRSSKLYQEPSVRYSYTPKE